MSSYILKRTLQIIPVLLAIVTLNFFLIQMAPGDPAVVMAGPEAPAAYVEEVRRAYGLDRPVYEQYWNYLTHVVRGDLGMSLSFQRPVLDVLLERIPNTLLLVLTGFAWSSVLGTYLGAVAARRRGTFVDTSLSVMALVLFSIPVFWLGLVFIIIFAVELQWLPSSGLVSIRAPRDFLGNTLNRLEHLILPSLTLGLAYVGQYLRLARASIGEVMHEDFITTYRGIGYDEGTIFSRFALRNALLPVVTVAGLQIGFVLAGAVLTETVFSWPGLGRLLYQAILARDYSLIMGCFIITSVMVVIASLITDIVYGFIDPRISFDQAKG